MQVVAAWTVSRLDCHASMQTITISLHYLQTCFKSEMQFSAGIVILGEAYRSSHIVRERPDIWRTMQALNLRAFG